jgi:enoyl-CoA hydratase/carnithine racemase
MDNSVVIERRAGDRLDITLNRPERSNALNPQIVAQLTEIVLDAYDDETRLIVLRGAGKHFCAGFDLSGGGLDNKKDRTGRILSIETLLQLIWSGPFVTVALVQGAAVGAGADLAANCDYRVCTAAASFRFPGFQLSGVTLGTGRLARLVGDQTAFDLVLRNAKVSGQQAAELGLASQLLEVDQHEPFVAQLAQDMAQVTKGSIVALKSAVRAPDRWQSLSRIPMSLRR